MHLYNKLRTIVQVKLVANDYACLEFKFPPDVISKKQPRGQPIMMAVMLCGKNRACIFLMRESVRFSCFLSFSSFFTVGLFNIDNLFASLHAKLMVNYRQED